MNPSFNKQRIQIPRSEGGPPFDLNYVQYMGSGGLDYVLQLKVSGVELAHITIHPNKKSYLREMRPGGGKSLVRLIMDKFSGATNPVPSEFFDFARKIREEAPSYLR